MRPTLKYGDLGILWRALSKLCVPAKSVRTRPGSNGSIPSGNANPQKDKLLKEDKLDRSSILGEDKLGSAKVFYLHSCNTDWIMVDIFVILKQIPLIFCLSSCTHFSLQHMLVVLLQNGFIALLKIIDQIEQSQRCCFIDSAILICKLQHLNPVPVKTQIELIVAMHYLLAEYGLCCAGGDGEIEEGTFLKLAIKHLLSSDMKLKSNFHSLNKGLETMQCDEQLSHNNHVETSLDKSKSDRVNVASDTVNVAIDKGNIVEKDVLEGVPSKGILSHESMEKRIQDWNVANAVVMGPMLRSDSSYEDDLVQHKNTSRCDYQTKEQCADVFQYILPYAKASSRTGLVKLRRVLRAIRKHFPQPPDNVLAGNAIDKFLDDPNLCEDKLSKVAGSDGFLDSIMQIIFPNGGSLKQLKASSLGSSDPYLEVYCNLYYLLAQSEEISATDKWAGFVLTKGKNL
ncbi:hypothetical protein ACSBR2_038380 [Camellia fascicularis]